MKNPHSEWIHQIKSKSGFLGFMIRAFLWGKDPKKLHLASGLNVKIRHIPANKNLFCQVDDMASDQGEFSVLFYHRMHPKFYRKS